MKKLFFFLAVAALTSFAACKSGETKSDATADTTVQTTTVDTLQSTTTTTTTVADSTAK